MPNINTVFDPFVIMIVFAIILWPTIRGALRHYGYITTKTSPRYLNLCGEMARHNIRRNPPATTHR